MKKGEGIQTQSKHEIRELIIFFKSTKIHIVMSRAFKKGYCATSIA